MAVRGRSSELTLGLVGDVGDLVKLVQAHEGVRAIENARPALEHELADVLWSLLVIANDATSTSRRRSPGRWTSSTPARALRATRSPRVGTRARSPGARSSAGVRRHESARTVTHPSRLPLYGRGMEEARSVLERFERIESMRRANAGPVELLEELRALLREAEAWAREEGGDAGIRAPSADCGPRWRVT